MPILPFDQFIPQLDNLPDQQVLKNKMLNWSNQFSSTCFLDSNSYLQTFGVYQWVMAVGSVAEVLVASHQLITNLDDFFATYRGYWTFGNICFGTIAEDGFLRPTSNDPTGFPSVRFFVPQVVLFCTIEGEIQVVCYAGNAETYWNSVIDASPIVQLNAPQSIDMQPSTTPQLYKEIIKQLQHHIQKGDCYEINFCQEYTASNVRFQHIYYYSQLTRFSPNPFSCLYTYNDAVLMCASPERYLTKRGDTLISQPIKGTHPRIASSSDENIERQWLKESAKNQRENVMIVDLVRNDLSGICQPGTVKVDELFGIYTFPQVHQMISTISGKLKSGALFSDILKATFPMGSMTGAPKIKVMELIQQYETTTRGLFSGTVGYINPAGDFDFNVVIRSLLYNSTTRLLRYLVGGGITWYSNAEEEYAECEIKAAAIKKVLAGF